MAACGWKMNVDPIPTNLTAVHELLAETLGTTSDSIVEFGYGMAIFPRVGLFDAPVFGALTCGGESTTLTYRLLQCLDGFPLWLSGRVPAAVEDAMTTSTGRSLPAGLLDQPVLHLLLHLGIGASREDVGRTQRLDASLFAGDLTAPLIFLAETRPPGWPR